MTAIDLGHGHMLSFFGWAPNRSLNPQYADLPDVARAGAVIVHRKPDGEECTGSIHFDCEVARRLFPERERWTVECWEPLTLSPSILCTECGDHGFVRAGRWVPA